MATWKLVFATSKIRKSLKKVAL